jgi:hypothetical protein
MLREVWLKRWVVVANGLLFLYGVATAIRDALPSEIQSKYQLNIFLHKWSVQTWIAIFCVMNLMIVLDGAIRALKKRDQDIFHLSAELEDVTSVSPEVMVSCDYRRGFPDHFPVRIHNQGPGTARNVELVLDDARFEVFFQPQGYLQQGQELSVVPIVSKDRRIVFRSFVNLFREYLSDEDSYVHKDMAVFCENIYGVRFGQKFCATYIASEDEIRIWPSGGRYKAPKETQATD